MRPLYETSADLDREKDVAQSVEAVLQCKLVKMPIRYGLDYAIEDAGKVVAFCEIKCRTYTMQSIGNMGGYLLSLGKWMSAKQLYESTGLPFVLIVRATDGMYYATFRSFHTDVSMKGRKDRGDWQDIEPCALIDVNKFKRLG